jgi:predicted Fe-S protein YdhL (DUF1289 family)
MTTARPSSPCIKVCAVDGAAGLCVGCGRTLREIASWESLSEAARLDIMAALPDRLAERLARRLAQTGIKPCAP